MTKMPSVNHAIFNLYIYFYYFYFVLFMTQENKEMRII